MEPEVKALPGDLAEPDQSEVVTQPEVEQVVEQPTEQLVEEKKVVPLEALHEERSRRKEMQQKLTKLEQEAAVREARNEERFRMLAAQFQPQQPQPLSFDQDPINHQQAAIGGLAKQVEFLTERDRQQYEAVQQQQYVSQVANWAGAQEREFAKEKPDYPDALKFVKSRRIAELQTMGYSGQGLMDALNRDEFAVIQMAGQHGRNPAEVIYEMASKTGYTGPAQKVKNLQDGVKASESLDGGSVAVPANVKSLLDMSDEDFTKALKNGTWAKVARGG